MAYGVNPGMIDEETPEERRMRLLREMNPFTPRSSMGEQGSIDSGFPLGFMPQGMMSGSNTFNTPDRGTFVDNGSPRSAGPAWRDPGSDGPSTVYQDPPVPGILATKVGEPSKPELDGILFGGTRSASGMDTLAAAKPAASIQAGPELAAAGANVTGANRSDRTNVPRSPDAPANAPAVAPAGFPTPARRQPRAVIEGGTGPSTAAMAGAPGAPSAASKAPGAVLPQPVAAAAADGLSRTPGSPDAMNWLKENADLFIGLGAGLLSGKNIGEGILHGLKMANESRLASAKEKELLRKNQAAQLQTATFAAMAKQAYGDKITNDQAIVIAQNPTMMNEVFKTQFPSEQWQQQGGESGQPGFLKNVRTGDIKADPSRPGPDAAGKETIDLTTPEQRRAHGIAPDDKGLYKWSKETGLQAVGQAKMYPSPTEAAQTAAQTARIQGLTGSLNKLADKRLESQGQVAKINRLDELLGKINTGGKTQALENFRKATGIPLDPNADEVQAAGAVAESIAQSLHESGTGALTEGDMRSFREQIPGISKTPGGNRLISDTLRGVAEHMRDATEIATKFRTGKMAPEEAQTALDALPDPFARMKEYQASRQPAAPAAAAPAAQAPSGGDRIWDPVKKRFL